MTATATKPPLPSYIIRRIDAAIAAGVLPVDKPVNNAMALSTVKCLPVHGPWIDEDVAAWINANRVNDFDPDMMPGYLLSDEELDARYAFVAELNASDGL